MEIRDGFIGAVGNTPLIRLASLSRETGCEILGKAEFLNPGGSVKDRAAWRMIAEGERFLEETVRSLGLDVDRAKRDAASDVVSARIAADVAEARRFGIAGTPGFLVNGVLLEGAYPVETFVAIIDRQLATTRSR